ncbi:ABC transporter permease [Halobellus captivus]|uniref:ABC transporter permease n=1 Tax=Halobellus captivus TaxID=2592614 RepID=UPI00119E5CAF|nr:ABC transporter permease [Halobellus captivus]
MAGLSLRYFLKRTIQTFVLILFVLTFLFFFFRMMPGSVSDQLIFSGADPQTVAQFEERWGLNDPLYVQYWRYLVNLADGNAGMSLQYRQPVIDILRRGVFNSLILVVPAITTGYIVGSFFGVIAGTKRGSLVEKYGISSLFFIGTFPSFFVAIILVMIFASFLGWVPTGGLISSETRRLYSGTAWWRVYLTTDFLVHYILPFSAIALRYAFMPALVMRTNVVEVVQQGFNQYQKVTGLPKTKRLVNIAKHASLPVITLYPTSIAQGIGGLVLVETVFNWPGIGYTLVQAVFAGDYPLIQFVFFLIATFIIIANFAVDIIYGWIDPRVQVDQ